MTLFSVRQLEYRGKALITATQEFFTGKKKAEIRKFFNEALEFIENINPLTTKSRAAEIMKMLDSYIPAAEKMHSQLAKYHVTFTKASAENKQLKRKNVQLEVALKESSKESALKKLRVSQLQRDFMRMQKIMRHLTAALM